MAGDHKAVAFETFDIVDAPHVVSSQSPLLRGLPYCTPKERRLLSSPHFSCVT